MKTITLGELAATDKREWVKMAANGAVNVGIKSSSFIPIIPNLHRQILTQIQNGGGLDMTSWHHPCGTTHCYAGWTTRLAGALGTELENCGIWCKAIPEAAMLIIAASCPHVHKEPNFAGDCPENEALATIRRYAAMEGK